MGVYIFENGDKYEGEWFENERHGNGNMTYADGSRFQRPTTGRDLQFRSYLRLVETGVEASDDGECSGKPRDTCESFELSIVQIGLETYCSSEERTKCKSLL